MCIRVVGGGIEVLKLAESEKNICETVYQHNRNYECLCRVVLDMITYNWRA